MGRKKGKREEARTMRRREGWGCILSFGTARAAVGARMAKLLHGSSKCAQAARPAGVIAAHSAQTIRGGGLVHFYACQRTLCRAFDVCVRFWGVVVRARGATRQGWPPSFDMFSPKTAGAHTSASLLVSLKEH